MQEQIMDILLKQEDVSWKSILHDLVRTEQMDPWDINLTVLTNKFIDLIKNMQEHDFRISGKVLLAAAFLLKMKSAHLLDHDITNLDRLINQTDEAIEDDDFDNLVEAGRVPGDKQQYALIPRNPQPRNRKVSIHDLVSALQRAMATKKKILARQRPVKFVVPTKKIDIMVAIKDIYHKIAYYTQKENLKTVTFTKLLPPRAGKQEKVFTFLPLLHLEHQQKIETLQNDHFGEIHVSIPKGRKGKAS
tara:strand:- start:105 stop:845 length:741 start_codon:yes stop_codon:yes gene_type:complete